MSQVQPVRSLLLLQPYRLVQFRKIQRIVEEMLKADHLFSLMKAGGNIHRAPPLMS